eukprot:gnl/TRDRNA2_/TRDRNA2_83867_c0_seq2.p1 gnl/TRDRNA2_/TRDRNA2_83867_c0~~gnl/TRDRNA2_/TRDRNA2_83867_c0_seq2.p1  ORF type:complete len:210 (-),score=15.25 gnl/TRDRNA2_/TRDRNA2_83867_c0_seq2:23-652(-)
MRSMWLVIAIILFQTAWIGHTGGSHSHDEADVCMEHANRLSMTYAPSGTLCIPAAVMRDRKFTDGDRIVISDMCDFSCSRAINNVISACHHIAEFAPIVEVLEPWLQGHKACNDPCTIAVTSWLGGFPFAGSDTCDVPKQATAEDTVPSIPGATIEEWKPWITMLVETAKECRCPAPVDPAGSAVGSAHSAGSLFACFAGLLTAFARSR